MDEESLPIQILDQSQDGGSVEFRIDQGEFNSYRRQKEGTNFVSNRKE